MTLAHSWILHFFWILPAAGFALIAQTRLKRTTIEQLADEELLIRLAPKDHKGRWFLKGIFLLFSLGTMIFSLAGPRWGSHYQEVIQKGADIIILVDVSSSMMVEDVKPNRLERARREIIDFLKVVQGDRVGLVAFSGAAFVQCPLTLDYAALEMFLSALQPGLIPVPGTDMGAAIDAGLEAFDFKTETDKVILLITDGEDNENRGLEAARKAAEKGVKIFVFGIGEKSGGPIPAGDGKSGFKKDKEGNLVLSKLLEAGLEDIASVSGGVYARAVAGDMDLDILYFDGIKKRTEAQTVKSGKIKVYEERFPFFVLIAFLFLLLEGLTDEKAGPKLSSGLRFMIPLFIFGFIQFVLSVYASAAESPDELYRKGRFEEAEKAYARLDMDNPKDIRYRFNRGCAAYQNEQHNEASAAFSSVLKRTKDEEMRFKAAYNLGNTAYKQGDFESAADYYKKSLIYNPSNVDARFNLEMTLRALEKMKKEKTEASKSEAKRGTEKKEDKSEHKETDKEEKSPESKSQDEGTDKTNAKGQEESGDRSRTNSEVEKESEQKEEKGTGKEERPLEDRPENLSGELKPLKDLPQQKEKGKDQRFPLPDIDKNKAEALLDNINENRSRFLRFVIPEENRHGISSGKDW
jgi:Ca-activated chloride channel family protein